MVLIVQDVEVYLIDKGAGQPILFLHGVPDTAELWSDVIAHLSSSYRCLAPDLPGFGRSIAPKSFDCSLENRAQSRGPRSRRPLWISVGRQAAREGQPDNHYEQPLPVRLSLAHLGTHLAYSTAGRAEYGNDELAVVSLGIAARLSQAEL